MIKNIVVISDIHAGCQLAVCPPEVRLDNGGKYKPTKLQVILFDYWKQFWNEFVPHATRNEDYIIVVNGDAVDGKHHNSSTQITQNLNDQINICVNLLAPEVAKKKCKGIYIIRGTEAHVGESGHIEENIAKQLGTKPNESGQYAYYELFLKFGKKSDKLCHFTHHIGTTNSIAYESTAPRKEYTELLVDSARWGNEIPDFIIRSHRHRSHEQKVTTYKGNCFAIITPSWQLKTPFTYRSGGGRTSTPEIGGIVLREGDDGMAYAINKIWSIKRPQTVKI